MKPTLLDILDTDAANFACLLDVILEHPDMQDNIKLFAAMCAMKAQFISLWEKLEEAA